MVLIDRLESQRIRRDLIAQDDPPREASPAARVLLDAIAHQREYAAVRARDAIRQMRAASVRGTASSPAPTAPAITSVLLKPVGDHCNLRCTYCYEGEDDERRGYPKMTAVMLEHAIREVLAQARSPIRFAWHGGEPLMAGLPLFRAGMALQRKHNVHGVAIGNGVQTNGLLLTPQWIDFFQENAFSVGISIDGPPDVHDAARIGPRGRGSFAGVVAALRMAQDAGLSVGVISVIDDRYRDRARDLYDLFSDLAVTNYDIHPNFGMHAAGEAGPVHPGVFADFVIDLFDCWLDGGTTGIRIATFDDIVASTIGERSSVCYFAGTCTSIIAVDANGDVLPCTRPFDRSRYTFGNVGTQPLSEILTAEPFRDFRNRDLAAQHNANECRWYAMCHNGCPQHRSTEGRQDIAGRNLYCQCQSGIDGGFGALFEHAVGRIEATWRQIAPGAGA